MKIWAFSDAHGYLPSPPPLTGIDVAVLAGDICPDFIGSVEHITTKQLNWLGHTLIPWLKLFGSIPVLVIWGNHDFCGQRADLVQELPWPGNAIGLNDTWVEIDGKRFYGSPWSFTPPGWAFRTTEEQLRDRFEHCAPEKVDVLVSHGPPVGPAGKAASGDDFGSVFLDDWLCENDVELVICGHIHEAAGIYEATLERPYLTANVARCDLANRPVRGATVIEIPDTNQEAKDGYRDQALV